MMWAIDCMDDTCFVMVPQLVGTVMRGFVIGVLLGLVYLLVSLPVRRWWKRRGGMRQEREEPVLVIRDGERMLFKDDILIPETPSPMMLIDDNGWKEGK